MRKASASSGHFFEVNATAAEITALCDAVLMLRFIHPAARIQAARLVEEVCSSWSFLARSCLRGAIRSASRLCTQGGDMDLLVALARVPNSVPTLLSRPSRPEAAMALAQLVICLAVGRIPAHSGILDLPAYDPAAIPPLTDHQVTVVEQAASKHLFIDSPTYQGIGAEGETISTLSPGQRLLFDVQAPAWWRWLTPISHRHEDIPHLCAVLSRPLWVADDASRLVTDWEMAVFFDLVGEVADAPAFPGLKTIAASDGGFAWMERLRNQLGRYGFYSSPAPGIGASTGPKSGT